MPPGADAVARQDDARRQTRELFVGSGLLELRAEVVDGGIDELRVGVRLALDPLGVPVVLVEAGGLLFLGSFPILVDGRGNAGVKLQLRAVGEHEAARTGRVAAHHLLLLGEHDLLARKRRGHGRGQAGIAGADDKDVRLLVEADRLVTHNRSVGSAFGRLRAVRRPAAGAATRKRRTCARHDAGRSPNLQKIPP